MPAVTLTFDLQRLIKPSVDTACKFHHDC